MDRLLHNIAAQSQVDGRNLELFLLAHDDVHYTEDPLSRVEVLAGILRSLPACTDANRLKQILDRCEADRQGIARQHRYAFKAVLGENAELILDGLSGAARTRLPKDPPPPPPRYWPYMLAGGYLLSLLALWLVCPGWLFSIYNRLGRRHITRGALAGAANAPNEQVSKGDFVATALLAALKVATLSLATGRRAVRHFLAPHLVRVRSNATLETSLANLPLGIDWPLTAHVAPQGQPISIETLADELLGTDATRRTVIWGEGGTGKSTTALHLCSRAMSRYKVLPIWLDTRGEECEIEHTMVQLLRAATTLIPILSWAGMDVMLRGGHACIVLDNLSTTSPFALKNIDSLLASKAVVTARFRDDTTAREVVKSVASSVTPDTVSGDEKHRRMLMHAWQRYRVRTVNKTVFSAVRNNSARCVDGIVAREPRASHQGGRRFEEYYIDAAYFESRILPRLTEVTPADTPAIVLVTFMEVLMDLIDEALLAGTPLTWTAHDEQALYLALIAKRAKGQDVGRIVETLMEFCRTWVASPSRVLRYDDKNTGHQLLRSLGLAFHRNIDNTIAPYHERMAEVLLGLPR